MEDTLPRSTSLPPAWLAAFARRYDEIVREGFDANPLPALPGTEEERPKKEAVANTRRRVTC